MEREFRIGLSVELYITKEARYLDLRLSGDSFRPARESIFWIFFFRLQKLIKGNLLLFFSLSLSISTIVKE